MHFEDLCKNENVPNTTILLKLFNIINIVKVRLSEL